MPMLVSHENLISHVNDVFNACLVNGDGFDKILFYGRGAGKFPTASAVLGDVIDCVKHKITVFSQSWESSDDDSFIDSIDNFKSKWYVRTDSDTDMSAYNIEDKIECDGEASYIISEVTFAEAKKINAKALLAILD